MILCGFPSQLPEEEEAESEFCVLTEAVGWWGQWGYRWLQHARWHQVAQGLRSRFHLFFLSCNMESARERKGGCNTPYAGLQKLNCGFVYSVDVCLSELTVFFDFFFFLFKWVFVEGVPIVCARCIDTKVTGAPENEVLLKLLTYRRSRAKWQ